MDEENKNILCNKTCVKNFHCVYTGVAEGYAFFKKKKNSNTIQN
jgi:hypothetical protein